MERSIHLYLVSYSEVERLLHLGDYLPDSENNKLLEVALVPEPDTQPPCNTIRCSVVKQSLIILLENENIIHIMKPNQPNYHHVQVMQYLGSLL